MSDASGRHGAPAPNRRRMLTSLLAGVGGVAALARVRGIPEASALPAGTNLVWFSTIAELKAATTAPDGTVAVVHGYWPAQPSATPPRPGGDGGGGAFYWSAAAVADGNDGTIISAVPPGNPTPGRWKRIFDGPLDIRWFGAMPDGLVPRPTVPGPLPVEQRPETGIQAALSAAAAAGGGTVYVPAGVYTLWTELASTAVASPLMISSHVTPQGDCPTSGRGGAGTSKTDGPDYGAMLTGPVGGVAPVDHITIRDLRFDQNSAGNAGKVLGLEDSYAFIAILFYNVNELTVERCWFDTCFGTQTVAASGQGTFVNGVVTSKASHIAIRDNRFRFRPVGTRWYDASAIYTDAMGVAITGNYFYGEQGAGDARPTTAIETHRGPVVISGNVVDGASGAVNRLGFQTGMNVCSAANGCEAQAQDPTPTTDVLIADNLLRNVNTGVVLWSFRDHGFRNLTVASNRIVVAQKSALLGDTFAWGIGMNSFALPTVVDDVTQVVRCEAVPGDGYYDGVLISDNHIQCEVDDRAIHSYGVAGIYCGPLGRIHDLVVRGNVIVDAPLKGVALGAVATYVSSARIADNTIINAGRAVAEVGGLADYYRTALFVAGENYTDVTVSRNHIIEDVVVAPMPGGTVLPPRRALHRTSHDDSAKPNYGISIFENRVDTVNAAAGAANNGPLLFDLVTATVRWSYIDLKMVIPSASFELQSGSAMLSDGQWTAGAGGAILQAPVPLPAGAHVFTSVIRCDPAGANPITWSTHSKGATVTQVQWNTVGGNGLMSWPTDVSPPGMNRYQVPSNHQLYVKVVLPAAGQSLESVEYVWIRT